MASGVILAANAGSSAELQSRLLAQGKSENSRRVLPILQGMDTCGKDGVIRHVLRGLNPFGVRVASFEKPTRQDLAHHFLWRIKQQLPAPASLVHSTARTTRTFSSRGCTARFRPPFWLSVMTTSTASSGAFLTTVSSSSSVFYLSRIRAGAGHQHSVDVSSGGG